MTITLIWLIIAFLSGLLPFSVWVGQLALRTDIRRCGDGNPGATNVLRSGSRGWAALALLFDSLKGAIPVGLAYFWAGLTGWPLVAVALAPVVGHAFSPLLGFRGGKAVAVTFGIWTGLTLWEGPTVLGLALGLWFAIIAVDGWAMLLALFSLLAYLLLARPEPDLLTIWIGNTLILAWKHRADLAQWPQPRSWLKKKELVGTERTHRH
ncbi:MAG: glycerol-3-phosphate acyltransferase [Anaerolineae bacterium]|nr:glycerol-3-phosphate acyltransferase [Anaerolineae bacterium]